MSNRLALGTVQFGLNYGVANQSGQVTLDEAQAIVNFSRNNRILSLDTAFAYGESEQMLGKIGVSDFKITSKLPPVPDGCEDVQQWLDQTVALSLSRLRVDHLHGLLLHKPKQLYGQYGEVLYRGLQTLIMSGKVRKIGVSIYDPSELDALFERFEMDLVQAPFNVFDRRLLTSGWYGKLLDKSVELQVRSVFLQGLLLMPVEQRPRKFARWSALWNHWDSYLVKNDLTPLQACLRFALSFPEIDNFVVGVDSLQQLEEIKLSSGGSLPELPDTLICTEIDLLDPSRWAAL